MGWVVGNGGGTAFWGECLLKRDGKASACGGVTPQGPVPGVAPRLQAQHRQRRVRLGGQTPERRFDIGYTKEAQEADSEVP